MVPATAEPWIDSRRALVESALAAALAQGARDLAPLREAMAYSLLSGGKRLRPLLVLAGAETLGGHAPDALPVAVAVEAIHAYSLVHDDLPALDNDALRRGKATSHVVYGEAMAILVGDALLTLAFEALAWVEPGQDGGAAVVLAIVRDLARAAGHAGMVGGQVLDMAATGGPQSLGSLTRLHALKTGALLRASVVSGGRVAGADDAAVARLERYGEAVGLAFQIVDDVLDATQSTAALGKPAGSDARNQKTTFVDLLGVDRAMKRAQELIAAARDAIAPFGPAAGPLHDLADLVVRRHA
jgi:geranylgeranyl pyrophosphate synthase